VIIAVMPVLLDDLLTDFSGLFKSH
jgi:hypothetical protein